MAEPTTPDEIKARIKAIDGELSKISAKCRKLAEEQKTLSGKLFGVFAGDIVEKGGKRFKVASIDVVRVSTTPWLKVIPIKKDGNLSKQQITLFNDWKKVS